MYSIINSQRKQVVSRSNHNIPSTVKKIIPELEEDDAAIEVLRSPMLGVMRTSVERTTQLIEIKKSGSQQNTP